MVRVQAAEDGTVGNSRATFRLFRAGTIFDLPDNYKLPDWVVVVPAGTKTSDPPFVVKRDQKTKKWKIVGEAAPVDEGPRTFSELANGAAKAEAKALKGKTAADALA